jgi:hypothetical protein
MYTPAPQNTFALQASFFHHSCGGKVLDIADIANAPDRRLPESPAHDVSQNLRHKTLSPKGPGQDVAVAQACGNRVAQVKCADHRAIRSPDESVGPKRCRCQAGLHVSFSLTDGRMGLPGEIAADLRVLGIAVEYGPRISHADRAKEKAPRLESIREHAVDVARLPTVAPSESPLAAQS